MRVLKAGLIALTSLVAVGALAGTLSAQGNKDNNGNPAILQAVQALQGTANGLVATLNALVTTVNGISASTTPGKVLFTPTLVAFPPDTIICSATNVSGATHSVNVTLVNGNTAVPLAFSVFPTQPPGITLTTSTPAPAGGVRAFCSITVNDGTKNDVRGVIALYAGATLSDKDPIAAQ